MSAQEVVGRRQRSRKRSVVIILLIILVLGAMFALQYAIISFLRPAASTSGEFAGWHTFTDDEFRYKADFPCLEWRNQKGNKTTRAGQEITVFANGCLLNVPHTVQGQTVTARQAFTLWIGKYSYPEGQAEQMVLLRKIADEIKVDAENKSTTETTLAGVPALRQQATFANRGESKEGPRYGETTLNYWLFKKGNLYLIALSYPQDGPRENIDRFLASFKFVD